MNTDNVRVIYHVSTRHVGPNYYRITEIRYWLQVRHCEGCGWDTVPMVDIEKLSDAEKAEINSVACGAG